MLHLVLPGYWSKVSRRASYVLDQSKYWRLSKMLHLSIAGMALEIAFFILFTVFLWALYKVSCRFMTSGIK